MSFRRAVRDMRSAPPEDARMIAGNRDPLPDRRALPRSSMCPARAPCFFPSEEVGQFPLPLAGEGGPERSEGAGEGPAVHDNPIRPSDTLLRKREKETEGARQRVSHGSSASRGRCSASAGRGD